MSTQILFAHGALGTGTINCCFLCGDLVSASTLESVPTAGTFGQWYVQLTVAPGVGNSRTLTLQKNGSGTTVTVTISGTATTASFTGTPVSWASNDTIRCQQTTTGTPAAATWTSAIAFTPTTDGETIHGWFSPTSPTLNNFHPIFAGRSAGGFFTHHYDSNVMALAGTITKHRMALFTAPGAGKSHTFALRKNLTTQDGTGGTPDTRITISDTNLVGEATFSLSVVIGDIVDVVYAANSGTPAGPTNEVGTIVFVPTVVGAFQVSQTGGPLDTINQTYGWINQVVINWTTTQVPQIGHASNPRLTHLEVSCSAAAGSGKLFIFSVQKNGTDVVQAFLTGASQVTTSADLSGTGVGCLESETLQLSAAPFSTPTANNETRVSLAFNGVPAEAPQAKPFMVFY